MASITVRNLDDGVKARLRVRAAEHGRSMEEEARVILREGVERDAGPADLAAAIRGRFAPLGGVELAEPAPIAERPRWLGRSRFVREVLAHQADAALAADLASLADETTDDLPWH